MAIYKTSIIARKQIAENTLEISFKRPSRFVFRAGQYMQLSAPKLLYPDTRGASRVFSIVSSPLDNDKISVAFRDTGSGFKRTLKELPINAPVNIEGPHGFFTLPQSSAHPIIFIAGGIGITPYLSMIRFATKKHLQHQITLIYANRNKESAAYLDELEELREQNPKFVLKKIFRLIDKQYIKQFVKDSSDVVWYIVGPPSMVALTQNILFSLGVDEEKIHFEGFTGYE